MKYPLMVLGLILIIGMLIGSMSFVRNNQSIQWLRGKMWQENRLELNTENMTGNYTFEK